MSAVYIMSVFVCYFRLVFRQTMQKVSVTRTEVQI